ncbi:MAG: 1-acyl-sn-glycerol-3-phosphate acyltransferase [Zoogloeaceae bacterium]|jgi:1-acyl-sn-glycerol-3-phosphate acyltransferase|nr:1-acyl-sn-glycerol-3-phosphate acyltransferase [Zoogloeaceae bacterium]
MIALRSFVFWVLISASTIVFGTGFVLSILLPLRARFWLLRCWRASFNLFARGILGLRVKVLGRENIPEKPTLVLAKHESAWETVGLQDIFIPAVFVMKKELLRVPFFGWGLYALNMIAIDRGAGRAALRQMLEQGLQRLRAGIWIIVFPEGTRVPPGETVRYKSGAAYFAMKSGMAVVPVAHNAADVWPKKSLRIRPGLITVSVGPPIATEGLKDAEVNRAVETWIEGEMRQIAPWRYTWENTETRMNLSKPHA